MDFGGKQTAGQVLDRIRQESRDESEKGRWFEQLFMRLALQEPEFEIDAVWRWPDWPERQELTGRDGRDNRVSLEQFLSQLPDPAPGAVAPGRGPRDARTAAATGTDMADPFEGVWGQALLWLQEEPDATAKDLFERLRSQHSDRFAAG